MSKQQRYGFLLIKIMLWELRLIFFIELLATLGAKYVFWEFPSLSDYAGKTAPGMF